MNLEIRKLNSIHLYSGLYKLGCSEIESVLHLDYSDDMRRIANVTFGIKSRSSGERT